MFSSKPLDEMSELVGEAMEHGQVENVDEDGPSCLFVELIPSVKTAEAARDVAKEVCDRIGYNVTDVTMPTPETSIFPPLSEELHYAILNMRPPLTVDCTQN